MNILEIAKEYATITDLALAHEVIKRNCYLFKTSMHLEAYAAAISAKAIEDYKKSLVPVYGIVDSGTFVSIEETEEGANRLCSSMNKHDDCNYSFELLYALPKETP